MESQLLQLLSPIEFFCGWVFRISRSCMESQLLQLLILDGFSKKIVASSPLQVEALAFMEACLVMTRKELKNVCITGDNQSLVLLSSSENASPRESVYYS